VAVDGRWMDECQMPMVCCRHPCELWGLGDLYLCPMLLSHNSFLSAVFPSGLVVFSFIIFSVYLSSILLFFPIFPVSLWHYSTLLSPFPSISPFTISIDSLHYMMMTTYPYGCHFLYNIANHLTLGWHLNRL
jgi:hypothetical protein